jgi:flagellar hook-basal body complex protein FliE
MIRRRMVAVGVVVAAVAAGGVAGALIGIPGLSSASSSPPLAATAQSGTAHNARPHVRGFFGPGIGSDKGLLDAAAKALKLSTQDLLQKLSDGKTTIADIATQQKVDLQTVMTAMEAVANTDISNLVNNPLPAMPPFGKGPLGGSGGSGGSAIIGPAGPGFGLRGVLGGSIDAVANALGISSKDLFSDLGNGQSIADIAKAKSIDVTTLINTLVTDAQTQIDASAKAGTLPPAAATKLEANLKQLITDAVNNSSPKMFGHLGGFGRWRGGRAGSAGGPLPAPPASTN